MSRRILIVEDEQGLVMGLTDRLQSEGYTVETAEEGNKGFALARDNNYDLIILDVMLPHRNGYDVCRDLRQTGVQTPIIMLTAKDQTVDKVIGLKIGADDYVTKPFEILELLARIEVLLRRVPVVATSDSEVYHFGSVQVNFRSTEVYRDGRTVELSALEFKLLSYFIKNRRTTISRDKLLDEVWGYDAMPSTRTVDVHISALRQKLEDNPHHPQFFLTIHGLGYKFTD
jgi:two-component system alkaline phosphatase synthesis response regulator PhoP